MGERQDTHLRIITILAKAVTVGANTLTYEELSLVSSVDREALQRVISDMDQYSLSWCEEQLRYRRRRKELEGLPTNVLRMLLDPIVSEHARAVAADVNDTAGDSLYAPPPIDSDEHILLKLLEERRQAGG